MYALEDGKEEEERSHSFSREMRWGGVDIIFHGVYLLGDEVADNGEC